MGSSSVVGVNQQCVQLAARLQCPAHPVATCCWLVGGTGQQTTSSTRAPPYRLISSSTLLLTLNVAVVKGRLGIWWGLSHEPAGAGQGTSLPVWAVADSLTWVVVVLRLLRMMS